MINGKINLSAFVHVVMEVKGKTGQTKGIFIPFEPNNIFFSEKKNSYFDFQITEIPADKKQGEDDYFIKQKLDKAKYEALKATGAYPPNLGYARNYVRTGGGEVNNNPAPNQVFTPQSDDMPF